LPQSARNVVTSSEPAGASRNPQTRANASDNLPATTPAKTTELTERNNDSAATRLSQQSEANAKTEKVEVEPASNQKPLTPENVDTPVANATSAENTGSNNNDTKDDGSNSTSAAQKNHVASALDTSMTKIQDNKIVIKTPQQNRDNNRPDSTPAKPAAANNSEAENHQAAQPVVSNNNDNSSAQKAKKPKQVDVKPTTAITSQIDIKTP